MDKNLLKRELQMCYSDQAEHFAHTRQKKWPEIDYIKTYLGEVKEKKGKDKKESYKVIELGCGAGRLYPELQSIWGKQLIYIGGDLAPGMVDQAVTAYKGMKKELKNTSSKISSRAKTQRVVSDMITLLHTIPDNSVDCVISIASLQHLMTAKERKLVRMHSYRILKYGGSMISVNRSYSDRFLNHYRRQQLASVGKSIIYPGEWKWNDLIIPRKDPQRQKNKQIRRRYYHLFTLYELKQLCTMSGFVINKLGYVLQDTSYSEIQWRQSRNTLLIATKTIS